MSAVSKIEALRLRPELYVAPVTIETLATYVAGMDYALGGRILTGFDRWLSQRFGEASPEIWWRRIAVRYTDDPAAQANHESDAEMMLALLIEFMTEHDR